RPSWISLLISPPILPFLLPFSLIHAGSVNITVDDESTSIVYTPASSWHSSSVPCSTCLAPSSSIAFQGTWHDGTHIIPTVDDDDVPQATDTHVIQPSTPATSGSSGKNDAGDDDDSDEEDSDEDTTDHDGGGKNNRRSITSATRSRSARRQVPSTDTSANPFFTPSFDSDDAGFVDHPVFAQFNFTGSAVYVYALTPLGAAPANSTPTFMNLTFALDSHPAVTYQHAGSASASGYLPSQLVFGQTGLTEAPHSLTIQIGPDSVLLLDYIVYTQEIIGDGEGASASPVSPTSDAPGAQETGSVHNIATFAGAVGGSVGLLAVLSLSLAISIYRRRLRAARRDRRYRRSQNRSNPDFDSESFHTDGSEDSPPMQGPAPFVPRYFPGTVVPAPPPPYSLPVEQTVSLLSSISPVPWAPPRIPALGEDISYADRPPPTPPPLPEDGLEDYFAPPSFSVAISSPIPAILAGYSPVATSSAPVSTSPVPRHTNGSGSRGVYATDPPSTRSRANSDAHSQRSGYSDRPPSFASQAPPLIPLPQQDVASHGEREEGEEEARQRRPDEDRSSLRSVLLR
ncbi:hypothetical protein C8Q80DRAFT_1108267, partial [Daedaleopsis nitida]